MKSVSGVIKTGQNKDDKDQNNQQKATASNDGEKSGLKIPQVKASAPAEAPQSDVPSPRAQKHDVRLDSLRTKAGNIGSLKMKPQMSADTAKPDSAAFFQTQEQYEQQNENFEDLLIEDNAQIDAQSAQAITRSNWRAKAMYSIGAALSVCWLAFSLAYGLSPSSDLALTPASLGVYMAGVFTPLILMWMVITSLSHRADVQLYAASLRAELQSLLFPSANNERVINQDIERMCAQAGELAAATKTIMKSLQRARQGLRTEVRDFTGVTKKAEFHIDRLSETLHERAGKLGDLTEEIDQRARKIDERTHAGVEAWDEATLQILERSGEMEKALGRGADRVLDAADQARLRTERLRRAGRIVLNALRLPLTARLCVWKIYPRALMVIAASWMKPCSASASKLVMLVF